MNFSTEIIERRRLRFERERRNGKQYQARASSVGECAKEIFHSVKDGGMRPPIDTELLQRFQRGNDIENIVIRELLTDGWTVSENQLPLEIWEQYKGEPLLICTGHIDGVLSHPDVGRAVFDAKSLNPNIFSQIETARDFQRMGSFWVKYTKQLPLYMYAKDEPLGFFLLDDCLGHWKILEMRLEDWLDECEEALQICRTAAIAIKESEAPDFCKNPKACKSCWCREVGVCHPPLYEPDPIKDLTDTGIPEILDVVESLKDDGKRYERLVKDVKETVKALGPGRFVCGHYSVVCEQKSNGKFVSWERIGT